jgi:hypothetical protein
MLRRGMSEQQEFRHELEATLAARQETGEELEPQLVDRFADRVEQEIERRVNAQVRREFPRSGHNAPMIPLALGSLGIAIPLIAIAGGTAGFAGVLVVCIAIVLVNLFWAQGRG